MKHINTRLNGALLNKSDKQNWKLDINPVDYSIPDIQRKLN